MESFKKALKMFMLEQKTKYPYYDRESRYQFVAEVFHEYLKISVLDVGSSKNYLKQYLNNDINYVSVDIVGEPNFRIDLEKEKLSQFENNSFNTVVCSEVLEHLDNLHDVFDDICRVSNNYVLISLPNNWLNFKYMLIKNKGTPKFYGLPLEKPIDRHKWFFNYDQALNFIIKRGEKNNFTFKYHIPIPTIHFGLKQHILNLFFKFYYKNQFGVNNTNFSSVWVLLKKN